MDDKSKVNPSTSSGQESQKSKILLLFIALSLVVTSYLLLTTLTHASELDEIEKKLNDLKHALEQSKAATAPLESTLTKLKTQLTDLQNRIAIVEKEVARKEKEVNESEVTLADTQELLAERVRSFYMRSFSFTPLVLYLSRKQIADFTRELAYQQRVTREDKETITNMVIYIKDLEEKKARLESEKEWLARVKAETDKQTEFLGGEIGKAKAYQAKIEGEIAELSARQKALLAAKVGTFQTSVGEVPLSDDPASRPDYNPGFSPSFAAFSFGAPHQKGMSQYGAFGRSKQGQSFEEILRHYYGDVEIRQVNIPEKINTSSGTRLFEDDYLKGIAEMPSSWADEGGFEALKAQAVAARTYALSYVGWRINNQNASGSICTSEACQVYNPAKTNNPDAAKWHQAVNDTKGKVMVSKKAGDIFSAWYASTAGGYTNGYTSLGHELPSSWDTKCGSQGCWTGEAFEKISGSPWFYKGWYRNREGNSCGRKHPWLTREEMADLLNAIIVSKNDSEGAKHIFPIDVASCFDQSEDVWSMGQMKDAASRHGGAVTEVTSVSVTYATNGTTNSLNFSTNRGTISVSGEDFYQIFNIRAPGKLRLTSRLFSMEKK